MKWGAKVLLQWYSVMWTDSKSQPVGAWTRGHWLPLAAQCDFARHTGFRPRLAAAFARYTGGNLPASGRRWAESYPVGLTTAPGITWTSFWR